MADPSQQPAEPEGVAEELHRRAVLTLNTLRMGGESLIRPSAPPALLSSLTDHLLVVASDAIKAVASSDKEGMDPVRAANNARGLTFLRDIYASLLTGCGVCARPVVRA